jgi:outer membrane protein assembly factor BamB
MRRRKFARIASFVAILFVSVTAMADDVERRLIVQGNGRLAIVDKDGRDEWTMRWGPIHDIHVLANGNVVVQKQNRILSEIDRKSKRVVWTYDASSRNGNAGKRVEIHSFQPLDGGKRFMIAESGPARIIEIDREGKLLHEMALKVDNPSPHRDTRLARKLNSGNYLVCHEGDGAVREYHPSGKVVWEFKVPLFGKPRKGGHGLDAFGNQLFSALRLPNGNTLIGAGNGHSVLEVNPAGKVVWKIEQNDLPNIRFAWITTLEVLDNGNYVIGNCHAGPGQPLLVEIEPKSKKVIWTFDRFNDFGNSVSNSQLLDVKSIR